jgi:hypothetical protein
MAIYHTYVEFPLKWEIHNNSKMCKAMSTQCP